MEQQLHQKEDMGEILHVVDFDQLKIENQQYLDRIEERNTELLRLKATTGKAVQVIAVLMLPNTMKQTYILTSRVASVAMCASSVHQQVEWVDVHCVWHQAKSCRDAVIVSLSTHHALQLWASI